MVWVRGPPGNGRVKKMNNYSAYTLSRSWLAQLLDQNGIGSIFIKGICEWHLTHALYWRITHFWSLHQSHALHPGQTPVPDASRYTLEDTQLPLERSPKILGVIKDPSISFHKHCNYASDKIDKRNNMLKALAGSSWGQDKETLLMTNIALGKSIANYAAPVWGTNASDSSFKKIQTAENAALRMATGVHKMASIDHLLRVPHDESQGPLRYAFCTVPCKLSGGGPRQSWHHNSRPRPMKETPLQTSINCSS